MRLILLFMLAALTLLVTAAPTDERRSAADQFHLSTLTQASNCFRTCHRMVTSTVPLPGTKINFPMSITRNCHFAKWNELVAACLPTTCESAPDLAYAIEYGRDFCRRAGVPGITFALPQWFLDSEGGAWYNATVASSAGKGGVSAVVAVAALFVVVLV